MASERNSATKVACGQISANRKSSCSIFCFSQKRYGGSKKIKSGVKKGEKSIENRSCETIFTHSEISRCALLHTALALCCKFSHTVTDFSKKVQKRAPRLNASKPYAPLPAKQSHTAACWMLAPIRLKTCSRMQSIAGRTSSFRGTFKTMLRASPPVMRIKFRKTNSLLRNVECASIQFLSLKPLACDKGLGQQCDRKWQSAAYEYNLPREDFSPY